MRILSWNINGNMARFKPVDADIVCLQELKSSRAALDRNVALQDPFDAFFAFPASKTGYSGVAVYTSITPLRAEEGLQPRSTDDPISPSYPSFPPDLDAEGRALVLDFGLFVLINVYCPNESSPARLPFKMDFHWMLQERVDILIAQGRDVILVGDMNVTAAPLDHCDGHLPSNAATFHDHPARAWFHNWLAPIGCMTDVVRSFWPHRKGMYTCWNTKISARDSNYGTRVDYILATQRILPWIKHADIQPWIKGSDHCPIYIDLHDEITSSTGEKRSLRHLLPSNTVPPRLATCHWAEFAAKQTLLSSFFAKTSPSDNALDSQHPGSPPPSSSQHPAILSVEEAVTPYVQDPDFTTTLPFLTTGPTPTPSPSESSGGKHPLKRRSSDPPKTVASKPSKKQKKVKGKDPDSHLGSGSRQRTLAAFFAPQSQSPPRSNPQRLSPSASQSEWNPSSDGDLATDYQLALRLASSQGAEPLPLLSFTGNRSSSNSKAAWSQLMAPIQPPKCTVHGEQAKELTVNKPGPNKGKTFFICSRPVGPGYDKGKGERLREEVDHRFRCNFFMWSANVRREMLKKNGGDTTA